MAKKTHDLLVKTGEYEKDGETKNQYENVGVVLKNEHGPYIIMKRTFNPAGVPNPEDRDTCIISMMKPKEKEEKKKEEEGDEDWDE